MAGPAQQVAIHHPPILLTLAADAVGDFGQNRDQHLARSAHIAADETLRNLTLGELTPEQVDMRTLVIIGSSQTCRFPRADGGEWVYTPRSYPQL